MAPHVTEKAGPGGRRNGALLAGVSLGRMVAESKPSEDGPSVSRAPRGQPMTPSERQGGLVACHVVCSATGGSEDLGPNRKSGLKGNTIHIDESIDAKLSKR